MGSKERIKRRDAKRRLQKKEKIKGTFKKWLFHLIIAIVWTVIVVILIVISFPTGNNENLINDEGVIVSTFIEGEWTNKGEDKTCFVLNEDNGIGYYIHHPYKIREYKELDSMLHDALEKEKHVQFYYLKSENNIRRIWELYIDGEQYLSRNETNTTQVLNRIFTILIHSVIVIPYLVVMWWKLYNKTPPFELNYYFGR